MKLCFASQDWNRAGSLSRRTPFVIILISLTLRFAEEIESLCTDHGELHNKFTNSFKLNSKLEQEPHELVHGHKLLDLCLIWSVLVYENETDREELNESFSFTSICATAAQHFMRPHFFAYFRFQVEFTSRCGQKNSKSQLL